MLDYIFQFVTNVYFHVGAENIRSQKVISRLGTTKLWEEEITYFGEQPRLNHVYGLTKEEWLLFMVFKHYFHGKIMQFTLRFVV